MGTICTIQWATSLPIDLDLFAKSSYSRRYAESWQVFSITNSQDAMRGGSVLLILWNTCCDRQAGEAVMKKYPVVLFALSLVAIVCASGPTLNLSATQATPAATQIAASVNCPSTYLVGYRVMTFNGVKAAVWYPSATPEAAFDYGKDISSSLAKDGDPLTDCGTFPLVIFSHGLFGCGDQSIFFTETLARSGYIVVAPDHKDALLCSVDGTIGDFSTATESPIMKPETWTDASYQDRKDSIETVLDGALQDSLLHPLIDVQRIGIAGHSLGGYTALAMVGGWASWKDSRFKAALLMSPYSLPFSINNTLKGV